MDGVQSFPSVDIFEWTINFILVFSGYELSIIGLMTCPIFVVGSLNGNSPVKF